jgi:hypothetical protein
LRRATSSSANRQKASRADGMLRSHRSQRLPYGLGAEFGRAARFPHVRQEPPHLAHRRGGDVGQHAGEVTLRIKTMPLGTGNQGVERGGYGTEVVVACEEPVLPSNGDPLERPLGGVIVNVEATRLDVSVPRTPLRTVGWPQRRKRGRSWPRRELVLVVLMLSRCGSMKTRRR